MELEVSQAAITSESTLTPIQFTPEAHFEEWLESVEKFRECHRQPATAEILIDGIDLDFETAVGLDDALPKIEKTGTLVLAEHGCLRADIVVSSALIDGVLRGNITASDNVVVENHAVVIGDIRTPRLTIRGGAIIDGECYFQGVQEPELIESNGYFEAGRASEPPPVWAALKGSLAKVWRTRLFQLF